MLQLTLSATKRAALSATFALPTAFAAEAWQEDWQAAIAPLSQAIERAFWEESSNSPASAGYPSASVATDRTVSNVINIIANESVAAELAGLQRLAIGWDGENAAAANANAISEARRFVRLAPFSVDLEPTLHVDGSVLLEIAGGEVGSLRFVGNGTIAYSIEGSSPGSVEFNGTTIPFAIRQALVA